MTSYRGNGPRAGRTTFRARRSVVNNASKTNPYQQGVRSGGPVLGPEAGISYGSQTAALQNNLFSTLANIRAQKGLVQSQFIQQLAANRAARVSGAVGAEESALQSGTVGSSADLATRSGVVADAAAGRAAAVAQRSQGLLGLQQQRIDAANQYYTGLFDVLAQKAAARAAAAAQALQSDQVLRAGDETAVAPASAPAAAVGAPAASVATVGARQLRLWLGNQDVLDPRVGPHQLFAR